MPEWNLTGSRMFSHAAKFIDAYHNVLQPLCRETGLPPMAMDILLFVANNPDRNTASDICQCRGLKPGIVSVHVDRLVNEGLLVRAEAANDRRKTRLTCTERHNLSSQRAASCKRPLRISCRTASTKAKWSPSAGR
ncbi:MAG: MarR family transcriptional regulator [Lachnospiraceae bacterium]